MEILTYDPTANTARLRRHPWLAVQRTWQILLSCWRFILMVKIGRQPWLPHRRSGLEREIASARFLVSRLVSLGPTFIKVGQALSTRPDILPLTYVRELAKLQDRVPAYDSRIAIATIEQELGKPILELFPDFDPEPISTASIGQVYRAHTKEGDRVVVKVQRPNLPWILSIDLALLRLFARATQWLARRQKGRPSPPPGRLTWHGPLFAKDMPYVAIVDQFGKSLFDQTDFVLEGHNADRFRHNFANFENVRSPLVYWPYTSRRVITLERIDGVKFDDVAGIEKMGVDFHQVVHLGVRAFIKQLLEDGFFHADTHPGNIFVTRSGEVVYIDWGMTDTLPRDLQLKLVDLFLHMMRAEYDQFVEDLVDLEMFPRDLDRNLLVPVVADVYEYQLGKRGRHLSMTEILDRVSGVLYRYPFRLPERFSFLMRSVGTMEGVVLGIWPTFRFLDVGMPYAAKLLLTVSDPTLRRRLEHDLMHDGRPDLGRLAQMVKIAVHEQTFAVGEFLPEAVAWVLSPEGELLRDTVTEALLSGDPEQLAQLAVLAGAGLAAEDLDLLAVARPLLAWLETAAGERWLLGVLGNIGQLPAASPAGEAIARMLGDLDAADCRELLLAVLDATRRLLVRHGRAMQPAFDWLALWLRLPAARSAAGHLTDAGELQLVARLVDLSLQAVAADIDLKPTFGAILALLLSREGLSMWRKTFEVLRRRILGGE